MKDLIEFYQGKRMVAYVYSSMVPEPGSYISIEGKTWLVERVTFALDHADDPQLKRLRCNVDLSKVPASRIRK